MVNCTSSHKVCPLSGKKAYERALRWIHTTDYTHTIDNKCMISLTVDLTKWAVNQTINQWMITNLNIHVHVHWWLMAKTRHALTKRSYMCNRQCHLNSNITAAQTVFSHKKHAYKHTVRKTKVPTLNQRWTMELQRHVSCTVYTQSIQRLT